MKHWFVNWLEEEAEHHFRAAERNRRNSENVIEDEVKMVGYRLVDQQQRIGQRLRQFAEIVRDMISCGLEEQAIAYYDAKQSIEMLPERPQKKPVKLSMFSVVRRVHESLEQASEEEMSESY